jgi:hypothetical protein
VRQGNALAYGTGAMPNRKGQRHARSINVYLRVTEHKFSMVDLAQAA